MLVCPDGHRPQALLIAFEVVQVKTRKIHVFRLAGTRKNEQDVFDFSSWSARIPLTSPFSNSFFNPLCLKL